MVPDPDKVLKQISTPEAHRLAELAVMDLDLIQSYGCFELFFDKYTGSKTGESRLIADALLRDAIILFCSAFDRTNANRLVPEEVYGPPLPKEALQRYQALQDIRDTFAAHSFGTLRQQNVGVECTVEKGELVPLQIGYQYASFGGWNANEKAATRVVVGLAIEYNKKRILEADQAVLKYAKGLPHKELAALPDLKVELPDQDEWRAGRKSFRQSKKERRTIDPRDQVVKKPSQP